ncbi:hypothetical protein DM02DRAFT_705546 [Periconia macrospinosa]|uniref:Uncharacterized protein n=1 Tax=Periconia macrospinosa TaxID=97972 RepID=A0A2V1ECZ1_9PLEO|nr:hypothetical protein DM02DRAFT_705546 [Periconia macrospinosa]
MNSGESPPLSFDSKTLTSVLFFVLFLVTFCPIIWVVYRVVKDFRLERLARKAAASSASSSDDLEKGRATTPSDAEMIDGAEINGGVCELEQPSLPELQDTARAELWDECCAGEIGGKEVAGELDADGTVIWEKMDDGEVGGVRFLRVRVREVAGLGVAEMEGDVGGHKEVEEEEVDAKKSGKKKRKAEAEENNEEGEEQTVEAKKSKKGRKERG